MQIFYEDGQASLFDRAGCVGKTSQALSPPERSRVKTSELYWRRSAALKATPFMSLDLTPDTGNLLGEFDWELVSPWRGDALTRNTGVSPRDERGSSLSQILQDSVPKKYYLTTTACLGILRRAAQRGKALPPTLKLALELQSGLKQHDTNTAEYPEIMAFTQNQRDEVRDFHDTAGALSAQLGIKQQTFVAGFSAGAGSKAGTIGYNESVAPTLKGSPSGTPPKDSEQNASTTPPPTAPPSKSSSYRAPPLSETVVRMPHHMSNIFRDAALRDSSYGGLQIDRKRRQELRELRAALGHPEDDREDETLYHVNDSQAMRQ